MLKHLLFGGCKISIPIEQKEKLLNLCMKYMHGWYAACSIK